MREEHLHLPDGFLACYLMLGILIELPNKLSAMLYHLIHCALLHKLSVSVAVLAVLVVRASIAVCAEIIDIRKRHATTLTKFLFFFHIMFVTVILLCNIHYAITCKDSADESKKTSLSILHLIYLQSYKKYHVCDL